MRQLLLSHLVSKLNSLDIYNIFIDMKTQISKCFVSAHTVMDRGVFKRRVFVFQLFFLSWRGDGDNNNNNYNKMCSYIFYVVVSLRTVVVFVTSFLRSVSCIYVW